MGLGKWARARVRRGHSYVVIHHAERGPIVTDHPSKRSAMAHVADLRESGQEAQAHDSRSAREFGVDPREWD